ncbi:tetratricopeptide repeat protein [Pseudochryseolinea flava]|uniref:Peptidase n=1 Tax=Pseudochryseolinea flava TaxID=2059302 RepID=A0A364Y8F9_9BACT|nr:tetratricopeptide repeat protein [Pseudochryseolinea flava]RAW03230.1 peptidase [Pseudochryseolinea flava]
MIKTRIILLVVSVALIAIIFLLPKVVIENDAPLASGDSTAQTKPEMHKPIAPETGNAIKAVRSLYEKSSEKEKNAIFADSLADLYREAGKFDSSAWFAEDAAKFYGTPGSWTKAGDQYYEAYTFAVDAKKQGMLARKAQDIYKQVLAENPKNLDVKTKLAMTYMTEAPMQGVALLREILEVDPTHEEALYNLGMLSVQSRQYDKAVGHLEKLIKISPEHIQGRLLLGISLMETGDKKGAREQLEKVKQLDNDPAVQETVDSYLKDLK